MRAMTSAADSRHRIKQCLAGDLPWSVLLPAERDVANAQIDSTVDAAARRISLGAESASAGIVTVALDDQGRMVEYRPDGSSTVLI